MKIEVYALRTFGIEIKKIGLSPEDEELIEEIRKCHEQTRMIEGCEEEPEFMVDEEFSNLCCEVWK